MTMPVKSPHSGQMRPRHPKPYQTHLPVLDWLLLEYRPHNILEAGCGVHSTPLFLRYPHIDKVLCVDTNRVWRGHTLSSVHPVPRYQRLADDTRLTIELADNVAKRFVDLDLNEYDLIFIDNGRDGHPEDRAEVLEEVCSRAPSGRVVVHDYDFVDYRRCILRHQPDQAFIEVFNDFEPYTAVVTF